MTRIAMGLGEELYDKRRSSSVVGFSSFIKRMMESKQKAISYAQRAFNALDTTCKGYLTKDEILEPIYYHGVETHQSLSGLLRIVGEKSDSYKFELEEFDRINCHFEFYKKVISADLVIPDFLLFKQKFHQFFNDVKEEQKMNPQGEVSVIFPTLAQVNPDYFATSFCSLQG